MFLRHWSLSLFFSVLFRCDSKFKVQIFSFPVYNDELFLFTFLLKFSYTGNDKVLLLFINCFILCMYPFTSRIRLVKCL